MLNRVRAFFHLESASGILLILAAILALIAANSSLKIYYDQLLSLDVVVAIGAFSIAKPLLLWINDGLMALFFLMVGLELKREIMVGELNQLSKIALPAIAAVGGMLAPAVIYVWINRHDSYAIQGWAIPTATDIAFALGVLSLLGSRIPVSLKIFLVSLAIFDDIGAIIIIALFYTANLSITAIISAGIGLSILFFMNRQGVVNRSAYMFIGLMVWVSLLKSGVHATLAGVAIAMMIPFQGRDNEGNLQTPMRDLEKDLHVAIICGVGFTMSLFIGSLAFEQTIGAGSTNERLGILLGSILSATVGYCWLAFVAKPKKM
ncbi:MAG: Na+/H+ antiporter NhaA [Cellvibrio sp.]|nr:Na+/H+ antiporter NhaA [Cellvibrio sp.]